MVECARVAERLLEVLTGDGLTPLPKTSGSKGLQVYCGVRTRQPERTSAYAKAVAEQLAAELPELVVAKMAKDLRAGRVLIDWSQNHVAKTTIAPSLRGRDTPAVSTPVTWDEVRAFRAAAELRFTDEDVLHRVEDGDLLAGLHDTRVAAVAVQPGMLRGSRALASTKDSRAVRTSCGVKPRVGIPSSIATARSGVRADGRAEAGGAAAVVALRAWASGTAEWSSRTCCEQTALSSR
ncbi:hypothetical protein [Amycolatopsis carbonis]|uniref:non-homologous end-joining DNA ligase LigD n=1 Tax=Amycolatopsis carbonis TaxID=715471 RepID=UPI003DA7A5A9